MNWKETQIPAGSFPLVVGFLVILAMVVISWGKHIDQPEIDRAASVAASRDVKSLARMCIEFRAAQRRWPASLASLGSSSAGVPMVDPWGRDYQLQESPDGVTVRSLGIDGVVSTDDVKAVVNQSGEIE